MRPTLSAHSAPGAAEEVADVDFILTQSPGRPGRRGSNDSELGLVVGSECVFAVGEPGYSSSIEASQPQLRTLWNAQSESKPCNLKAESLCRGGGSGKGPGSGEL